MPEISRPRVQAILSTRFVEVRDFLAVHLMDRGLAVEMVEPQLLAERLSLGGVDVVIADDCSFQACSATEIPKPEALLLLSASPALDRAVSAASFGAVDYLGVPFDDTRRLAETLDVLATRASKRSHRPAPTAEPVAAR